MFQGVGELDVLGHARIGGLQDSVDQEDPLWSWHLQEKIRVVGDRHELGEGGSSQDGVVGGLELGDLEVDVLGAVVVAGAEGDRQSGPADRGRPGSRDDAVEGLIGWDQGGHVVAHALQCAGEDDVEGAATVDEYFG